VDGSAYGRLMAADPTLCLIDRTVIADLRRWWETAGVAAGLDLADLAESLTRLSDVLVEIDAGWDLLDVVRQSRTDVDVRASTITMNPMGIAMTLLTARPNSEVLGRRALSTTKDGQADIRRGACAAAVGVEVLL
jgi:hypothetical protein